VAGCCEQGLLPFSVRNWKPGASGEIEESGMLLLCSFYSSGYTN